MPRAHYFLGNGVVGTSVLPTHATGAPDSVAYFCATCGEIWARILVEGSEGEWQLSNTPCAAHKPFGVSDWGQRPGSLVQSRMRIADHGPMMWAATLEALPLSLKNREVLLALRHVPNS